MNPRPIPKIATLTAALMALAILTGCAGAAALLAARQVIEGSDTRSKLIVEQVDENRILSLVQGESFQLRVIRKFTEIPVIGSAVGTTRTEDVTDRADYWVEDPRIATISKTGKVTALRPGTTRASVSFSSRITKKDTFDFVIEVADDGDPQNNDLPGGGGDGFGF